MSGIGAYDLITWLRRPRLLTYRPFLVRSAHAPDLGVKTKNKASVDRPRVVLAACKDSGRL